MPMIYCVKLKKMAEALSAPPCGGPVGERIQKEISQEAWQLWLKQQTILINENRLSLREPEARTFLTTAMVAFLFGAPEEKVN